MYACMFVSFNGLKTVTIYYQLCTFSILNWVPWVVEWFAS